MSQWKQAGWRLECADCGARYEVAQLVRGCPACRERGAIGLLEAHRAEPPAAGSTRRRPGRGLERWLDLLPIDDPAAWRSLGEGGTALVKSRVIGPRLGFEQLYFKLEQQNPTLSFKHRYVAVTLAIAHGFGQRRVAVSSTGNLAVSVAAYCAAYGMECLVIVPRGTPEIIIAEAELHGARTAVIERGLRFSALEMAAGREDWFPLGLFLRRPVQNPFGIEGYRSFAYEVVEDLGEAPTAMLFPCARGNGLYGAYKGFVDCRHAGWSDGMPRLIACQPKGANPLEVSVQRSALAVDELPAFDSIAHSTSEGVASDQALQAIRRTAGTAISADDEEIRKAVLMLGEEGLNVEAGAALPIACLPRLRDEPGFDPAMSVVCVLTASGVRWNEQAGWVSRHTVEVDSLDAFARVLDVR